MNIYAERSLFLERSIERHTLDLELLQDYFEKLHWIAPWKITAFSNSVEETSAVFGSTSFKSLKSNN